MGLAGESMRVGALRIIRDKEIVAISTLVTVQYARAAAQIKIVQASARGDYNVFLVRTQNPGETIEQAPISYELGYFDTKADAQKYVAKAKIDLEAGARVILGGEHGPRIETIDDKVTI